MRLSAETFSSSRVPRPDLAAAHRRRRVKCKLPIDLLSTFRVFEAARRRIGSKSVLAAAAFYHGTLCNVKYLKPLSHAQVTASAEKSAA
jgi:hypothetical protein